MDIRGSETEKNLKAAFACEAKRKCEFLIYSLIAKLEGYDEAGVQLELLSQQEREHTKLWFKWLNNGKYPHTLENLENVLQKEYTESSGLYPSYAQTAKKEGFEHLAELFEHIAKIEKDHVEKIKKLILNVKNDVLPNQDGTFNWVCSTCGGVFQQKDKPDYCPLCENENVFFFKKPN